MKTVYVLMVITNLATGEKLEVKMPPRPALYSDIAKCNRYLDVMRPRFELGMLPEVTGAKSEFTCIEE